MKVASYDDLQQQVKTLTKTIRFIHSVIVTGKRLGLPYAGSENRILVTVVEALERQETSPKHKYVVDTIELNQLRAKNAELRCSINHIIDVCAHYEEDGSTIEDLPSLIHTIAENCKSALTVGREK